MGIAPNQLSVPDLFSLSGRESSPASPPEPSSAAVSQEIDTAPSSRHVLPRDLAGAIKHLDDEELDRLVSAALEERSRRKKRSAPKESQRRARDEAVAAPLPQGKLNAVRAAFKAGVTPTRIAREFGISRSEIQRALAGTKP